MIDWKAISEQADRHGYMSGVDRQSDRVLATGEIFTPTELVCEMCQNLIDRDPDALAPGKTVLDPSCGDGQFLVVAKWVKVLHYGMTEADARALMMNQPAINFPDPEELLMEMSMPKPRPQMEDYGADRTSSPYDMIRSDNAPNT